MGKLTTKKQLLLADSPRFQGGLDASELALPIVCQKTVSLLPASTQPDAVDAAGHNLVATITTAKPKARQHTPQARERRRVVKDRLSNFEAATRFAYQMAWPLNLAITINWTALIQAGDCNAGNCLDREEAARESYLRSELSRCRPQTAPGAPFVAIWGRDIGRRMGSHTHIGLHCCLRYPKHLLFLVAMLERICGSPASTAPGRFDENVMAESSCKGWQVKLIYGQSLLSGALAWVDYIARQSEQHNEWPDLAGKAFGVSQAIGPSARATLKAPHGFDPPH